MTCQEMSASHSGVRRSLCGLGKAWLLGREELRIRTHLDRTTRSSQQQGLLVRKAERHDKLAEEVAYSAVGYVRDQAVEHKGPGHRVRQGFFELIELEMFIAHALLVHPDALYRENLLLLCEESGVHLIIRHNEEEDGADESGKQPYDQEQQLPRLYSHRALGCANCNPVGDKSTEDLTPAIEREPNACPCTLLPGGIPLRCQQSKAG